MIYLITGVPGSGKSLYAVSTLVKTLLADVVKSDGSKLKRRLVVDGIPDLLLPHELMAPSVEDDKGTLTCDGDGVANWHVWCKPGDVLLIDEVQRYWRPRGMSTKPPQSIKELETHRHKGVDLVLITQNPMLIDQNVRRLVGRHIHVRRLFGMGRAILYDWDGCSVDVHRTKTASSTMWSYPKNGYKLYKSSELHTKQKQKIPLWLALPVIAIVAALFVAPKAASTLLGAATGKGITEPVAAAVPASAVPAKPLLASSAAVVPAVPVSVSSVPVVVPAAPDPLPEVVAGCARVLALCRCYTATAKRIDKPASFCESETTAPPTPISPGVLAHVPDQTDVQEVRRDLDMIAWATRNRR